MAVKFFGQFLLEHHAVKQEDLLKAIELQESTNLKFGATALAMGLISLTSFERVHNAQRLEDLKFGDMAIKLGILTEEQVKQVLIRQKNNHLYIGEALVRIGALSSEDLKRYLDAFKEDQAPYVVDRIVIPAEVSHPQVWEICADLTFKLLLRVAGLATRTTAGQISDTLDPLFQAAIMPFKGTVQGRYALCVTETTRLAIAKAILKEDSLTGEAEEVLNDTVLEFVNIICGNIAAKSAQLGVSFEIDPPYMHPSSAGSLNAQPGEKILTFPIHVADGDAINLALFIKD